MSYWADDEGGWHDILWGEDVGAYIPQDAFHGGYISPHEPGQSYTREVVVAGPFDDLQEAAAWWSHYKP